MTIIKKHQPNQGFSLIEVLITMVILAVGLLSITGLQLTSLKNSHNALLDTQAHQTATSLMNKIRDNPSGLSSYLVSSSYSCTTAPTPSCISTTVNTTACTATELALSEVYHSICGNSVGSTTSGGVKNELPAASMTVSCIAADGSLGSDCSTKDINIGISWGVRNQNGSTSQRTLNIVGSIQ